MAYLFASPRARFQSFAKASLSSCTSPISKQNLVSGTPWTLFSLSANLLLSISSQRFFRNPAGGVGWWRGGAVRTRKPASLLYSGGKVTVVSHDKWVGHAVYQQEGRGQALLPPIASPIRLVHMGSEGGKTSLPPIGTSQIWIRLVGLPWSDRAYQ